MWASQPYIWTFLHFSFTQNSYIAVIIQNKNKTNNFQNVSMTFRLIVASKDPHKFPIPVLRVKSNKATIEVITEEVFCTLKFY